MRFCTRCVYPEAAVSLVFDDEGVCIFVNTLLTGATDPVSILDGFIYSGEYITRLGYMDITVPGAN